MRERAENMLSNLKRAGLKLTPQRIAIIHELAEDRTHPTAQSLFERVQRAYPTMSFATVYSTLDALTRHGSLGSLHLGGAVRFDPNTIPHDHAVCDACGKIADLPITRRAKLPKPEELEGFEVHREQRTYRGLCRLCQLPK